MGKLLCVCLLTPVGHFLGAPPLLFPFPSAVSVLFSLETLCAVVQKAISFGEEAVLFSSPCPFMLETWARILPASEQRLYRSFPLRKSISFGEFNFFPG